MSLNLTASALTQIFRSSGSRCLTTFEMTSAPRSQCRTRSLQRLSKLSN